jgi:hypothetical protein
VEDRTFAAFAHGERATVKRRSGSPARVVQLPRDMELHAVEEGVIVDRPGVRSASTKCLDVGLSRPSKILVGYRREWKQLEVIDLDHHGTAPVEASDLDLWSRPEAVGDGDRSVRNSIAKISAELHAAIVSSDASLSSGGRWRRMIFILSPNLNGRSQAAQHAASPGWRCLNQSAMAGMRDSKSPGAERWRVPGPGFAAVLEVVGGAAGRQDKRSAGGGCGC